METPWMCENVKTIEKKTNENTKEKRNKK